MQMQSDRRPTPTPRTSSAAALLLVLLAASSTGCGSLSPPQARPVDPPRVPAPPADLMEPPSSGSWSESVQRLFQKWQRMLTDAKPA